jgi:hypothetical protein
LCVQQQKRLFIRRICNTILKKQITCRGTPFWGKHVAKKMLIKDLEDGIGQTMKTQQLWESREEYQAFPYDFFCKHVYEVRQKELAAVY